MIQMLEMLPANQQIYHQVNLLLLVITCKTSYYFTLQTTMMQTKTAVMPLMATDSFSLPGNVEKHYPLIDINAD